MFRFALLIAAAVCFTSAVAAQDYPRKPVHMIVPFSAGGNVDVAAPIIAEQLAQSLHQPFLVENKPGAGGMVPGDHVRRAAAHCYTLLVSATHLLVLAQLLSATAPP